MSLGTITGDSEGWAWIMGGSAHWKRVGPFPASGSVTIKIDTGNSSYLTPRLVLFTGSVDMPDMTDFADPESDTRGTDGVVSTSISVAAGDYVFVVTEDCPADARGIWTNQSGTLIQAPTTGITVGAAPNHLLTLIPNTSSSSSSSSSGASPSLWYRLSSLDPWTKYTAPVNLGSTATYVEAIQTKPGFLASEKSTKSF